MDDGKRLSNLLRHIEGVRDDCLLLGRRIIERGEKGDEQLGLLLIANGQIHDNSKFKGIEWLYLNDGAWPRQDPDPHRELFLAALRQHQSTNPHHPEFYPGGISDMPPVFLAEMLADWKARSNEQGSDLMEWVRGKGADRFGYTTGSRVYRTLKEFVGLLLEARF